LDLFLDSSFISHSIAGRINFMYLQTPLRKAKHSDLYYFKSGASAVGAFVCSPLRAPYRDN